jgi:hypothetical protein
MKSLDNKRKHKKMIVEAAEASIRSYTQRSKDQGAKKVKVSRYTPWRRIGGEEV